MIDVINKHQHKTTAKNSYRLLSDIEPIEGEFDNWDKQANVFWEKVAKEYKSVTFYGKSQDLVRIRDLRIGSRKSERDNTKVA